MNHYLKNNSIRSNCFVIEKININGVTILRGIYFIATNCEKKMKGLKFYFTCKLTS